MSSPNASSSTATLWATASKEWVIQPKPKPGRKPKKDTVSPAKAETEQVDAKGRRIQNRAAQRAFRERKQSQLSELQARIQSYEQGEIERNVALQNIAKRLKEENDKLRHENLALQAKLLQMQQMQQHQPESPTCEVNSQDGPEKKRRRRDECPSIAVPTDNPTNKKPRKNLNPDYSPQAASIPPLSFSLSVASTPESNGTTDSHFSSLSYETHSELDENSFHQFNGLSPDLKDVEVGLRPFASFGCGFCSEDTICICQEMAVAGSNSSEFKSDDFGNMQSLVTGESVESNLQAIHEAGKASILDNLPPYQPPVALRKRPGAVLANSIFPVQVLQDRKLDANCSGDPSNCLACGDDAFGKAFCAEIGKSISMRTGCGTCPSQTHPNSEDRCCGISTDAPSCGNCPSSSSVVEVSSLDESAELMPTDDAWRKLKAHPNVEFADLSLLAEVVSSRSKCSGPRLLISPIPQLPLNPVRGIDDLSNVQNRYVHRPRRSSPPLRLVPQEVLLECGRRRLRQVNADGVREALRMLDAKFS